MPSDFDGHERILVSSVVEELSSKLSKALQQEGYQVSTLALVEEIKSCLNHEWFNLIVMDRDLYGDGEDCLLSYVKRRYPSTIVIILSQDNCIHKAIECIRKGAYEYLVPPFEESSILAVIEKCLDRQRMGLRHKEMTRSLEEKVIHLQQLNQRMAALYKIIRDTRGLATMEDSLNKVSDYLGEAIDLESSFCLLLDEDCQKLVLYLKQGRETDLSRQLLSALLQPGEVLRETFKKGRNINDVSLEVERDVLRQGLSGDTFQNVMICPMIIRKNLYGYLCLINSGDRPAYTFADRQMLSIIASQAVTICEENYSLMQSSQLITMGNLTAELAHDLKNPLANIKGVLQTLEGKWDDANVRNEAFQMIYEEMGRAENMTSELLAFAKTQELEIGYWNVHDLLRKALSISKNTLSKARVNLQEKYYDEPLMVWANDNELVDAFVNIIVNATQAMPEGGTLTISTQLNYHQGMQVQGIPSKGRYVQLEFTDSGVGMTRWEMDRIFERFYTTKSTGTGLGLSIVDRVVKKYQGFIDVKSAKDKGTTFFINLPQR